MNKWQRRTAYYVAILMTLVGFFTVGYWYGMAAFEDRPRTLLHSLQIVVETFTTTGFGSDSPWTTPEMNLFVIGMDSIGTVMIFLALPVFLFPAMEDLLSTSVPTSVDEDLSDHVVIAMFSARADALISELDARGVDHVVVDPDRERATSLYENGYTVINAEPDSVSGLQNANVTEARAVVADVSDRLDTSIVLTARELSEDIRLVSVVEEPDTRRYHELAGADIVLSPRLLLGERIAEVVSTGVTTDLGGDIEVDEEFQIREVLIQHGSPLAGEKLADSGLREDAGVNVIGAWFQGTFRAAVDPDTELEPGSVLLVTGRMDQFERLEQMPASAVREFDHGETLIVGYGHVGQAVAEALAASGQPYTVIDREDGAGVDVVGEASDEDTLQEAGIETARSVALTIPDDVEAEFATLVMRDMNTDLNIAARTGQEESVRKMYRAGANYVLSLAQVTGRMAASAVLDSETGISMGARVSVRRTAAPGLAGQTLGEADVRGRTGCTVIAVDRDGGVRTDLGPSFRVESGDELVVAGPQDGTREFVETFG